MMSPETSLNVLQNALRSGKISPSEVVEYYAARMDELNPRLNALLSYDKEAALSRQRQERLPCRMRAVH